MSTVNEVRKLLSEARIARFFGDESSAIEKLRMARELCPLAHNCERDQMQDLIGEIIEMEAEQPALRTGA